VVGLGRIVSFTKSIISKNGLFDVQSTFSAPDLLPGILLTSIRNLSFRFFHFPFKTKPEKYFFFQVFSEV
jgi:hypothetical protein